MKISVITVCLNAARTIGYTLESFRRQTHGEKQLIVVDGGSTDGTLDIVRSFGDPDVRIVEERVAGIFPAMNAGLRAFDGDAVGFLNADDTFHDDQALSRIASGLAQADVVYGDIVIVADHRSKTVIRSWKAGSFKRSALRWGWIPPHPSFYLRREVLDRAGAFDMRYPRTSDYDFMLRVLLEPALRVRYLKGLIVDFGVGGFSTKGISTVVLGNLECAGAARAQFGPFAAAATFVMKPLRKVVQIRVRALPLLPLAKD